MANMKIDIDVSVDNKDIVVHITGNGTPAGGWAAAWECIGDSIKKSLVERDKEQADKAKDAGKDLPSAMIEVALQHAFKQDK